MLGSQNRLRILTLFILLASLILISKLYFVQIIAGENFRLRAEHQYVEGGNLFDRGGIFFSTKDGTLVPAANVKTGFTLYVNPNQMIEYQNDFELVYQQLSAIIPINREIFFLRASKVGDPYEEITKHLDQDTVEKIKALKIPGVSATREKWRVYPGETMAAHIIGLVGYAGDEYAGRYGLERSYEKVLKRESDGLFVNFFAEIFSNIKTTVNNEGLDGDIITTIEPSVEAFLESELEKVTQRYSSDFTGGIVMDPNTGEIVAMALTPTFDPNTPGTASDASVFSNKLVEDRYEMGSIIKALTYSIGLDTKAITAKTTYNDPGCMILNTETFCNYDGKSHGSAVTMQSAINQSLNTGAAFVALRVGNKKFSDYMLKFGLDEKTGIDLPNEGNSLVSNLKTNRSLELAQASFGQGIALTPIGTVRALSALANGGTLITPHLVKEVRYKIGTSKNIDYPKAGEGTRVISQEASQDLARMLTEVVDRSLRFGQMRLENYSVAAKTGTAQIANPDGGGYYEDRSLHSFFGYFPAYEPRFLVFFFTYYPKEVQFASETLTDSFFNMTKFLINYYNIPPDRQVAPPESVSLN
ncbi:MAG: penicillin-binding protein 2 [Candidatus Zambryskibacteria bacterium]|nr:penicillin-binding protein 2 [Candidatus Zambryskibacteria bacterium]